jgi:hypothetical protein
MSVIALPSRVAPPPGNRLLAVCLLLAAGLVIAQEAPDVDVKYSDLYNDVVFAEHKENWRQAQEDTNPWRENPDPEPRARFSSGFDLDWEAQRQAEMHRRGESPNLQNDPNPTSLLRWEF